MLKISTLDRLFRQNFLSEMLGRHALAFIAAGAIASTAIVSSPIEAQPAIESQPEQEPDADEPDPIDATYDYLLWLIDILLG